MTDLLSPAARRAPARSADGPRRRGLVLGSSLAGLSAAATTLGLCMAAGLAGWFGADAGRYGDTRDAITVGADAWLLGHGSGLLVQGTSVSVVPLGLTLVWAVVAHRAGRRSAARTDIADLRGVLVGTAVMATVYAVAVLLTSVLATRVEAEPHLFRAFVGALALALLAGGSGMLRGAGQAPALREHVPDWLVAVASGAASVVLLLLAVSAFLVAGALVKDFGDAANVLARLHTDGAGGLMYTVIVLAFVPNAVLFGTSYLLGPGFLVGTGTVVSPSAVVLGPVPAFPLLAALPDDAATPSWAGWLVGVPVAVSVLGSFLVGRRQSAERYEAAAARGLGVGLLAALVVSLLAVLAGGAVGPGRMADIGPVLGETLIAACLALAPGAMIGAVLAHWRAPRREPAEERPAGRHGPRAR